MMVIWKTAGRKWGQLPFFDSMAQVQFGRAVLVFFVEFVGEDGDDFVVFGVEHWPCGFEVV